MLPGTIKIGNVAYAVEAKPHPDGMYVIRKMKGDKQTKHTVFPVSGTCTCEAAKFRPRQPCKHVTAMREYVAAHHQPERRTPMALRGKKPELVQKRLKCLFYGSAGVGKTTAALQFPKSYLIDTERGAENDSYVKLLSASGGAYFFTTDPDELISELRSLLSEKHPYKTVIIDPLTVIYNDLLDRAAMEVGTDFGKHKGPADRKIKHILQLLTRLDMNVIITSHAKPKWSRVKDAKGKDTVIEDGNTFDCYGRLDYLFDLVFEIQKRGIERVGIVKKTRVEGFPEGDIFPFTFSEISRRYGKEILEKEVAPVPLATAEQVEELTALLAELKNGDELKTKYLEKAGAEELRELSQDQIAKCIASLSRKVPVPA